MGERSRRWIDAARRDVFALYLAARDPRVPRLAKILALATAAYALSPIDLIPDFIPILGYLDDLIIVPLAIYLTVRLIPVDVMADLRAQAETRISARPKSLAGAAIVVAIWVAFVVLIGFAVVKAY